MVNWSKAVGSADFQEGPLPLWCFLLLVRRDQSRKTGLMEVGFGAVFQMMFKKLTGLKSCRQETF